MKKNKYICPVCGYDDLNEAPYKDYDAKTAASFEICPCCGTEFGYTDDEISWLELRKRWIKSGHNWFSKTTKKPKKWSYASQLLNIKKIPKM
jgi:hypothetical protein